tara:strand:- start:373 stop:732 length:360 start_codon:yes stop_codon:yes gene_type:complete
MELKSDNQNTYIIILLHLFNFLDAAFSLHVFSLGVEEANPLLWFVYGISPGIFIVVKFLFFTVSIEVLNRFLKDNSRRVLVLLLVVYFSVLVFHVWGLQMTKRVNAEVEAGATSIEAKD